MAYLQFTPQQVETIGEGIYRNRIRDKLSHDDHGKFVVIDISSNDFEIADSDSQATRRLLAKRPQAVIYGVRVGYDTAYTLGAHLAVVSP